MGWTSSASGSSALEGLLQPEFLIFLMTGVGAVVAWMWRRLLELERQTLENKIRLEEHRRSVTMKIEDIQERHRRHVDCDIHDLKDRMES